jgi:hypothetical protein
MEKKLFDLSCMARLSAFKINMKKGYMTSMTLVIFTIILLCFRVAYSDDESIAAGQLLRFNLLLLPQGPGKFKQIVSGTEWEQRRQMILSNMQIVMGQLPTQKADLRISVLEEQDRGKFVQRFIQYYPDAGQPVPAYLLIPKEALDPQNRHKFPAILALHQTDWTLGPKLVVGLGGKDDDSYGLELANQGYVVIAPTYPFLSGYEPDLERLGYKSGSMKAIWDNMRAIDLLETLPFVDCSRIAVIGHSLGGHNGLFTAVFDTRIKVVISNCGLHSFLDFYPDWQIQDVQHRRYMPALGQFLPHRVPFDFAEIIAAIAPRACLVIAPKKDVGFKWTSAAAMVEAAKPVYRLLGADSKLQIRHPDSPHSFPTEERQASYDFIKKNLFHSATESSMLK